MVGFAHQLGGVRAGRDADHQLVGRGPGAPDGLGFHVVQQLAVHFPGRDAERDFPKCDEIAALEEIRYRALGLFRDVDFAFVQTLEQLLERDVNHLEFVGAFEQGIGDGFLQADTGNLGDDVVLALEVLDVDRGVDVNTLLKQFLDVEIALGMAAARCVGVGEFIDQDRGRAAGQEWHPGPSPPA